MLFFVGAHLYLFKYMSAPIAFASTLLSVATAYPLAWLFEKGGNTVWAPALLHTTVHAIKLLDLPVQAMGLTLGWMAVCAGLPWLVFLVPRRWFRVSANATT